MKYVKLKTTRYLEKPFIRMEVKLKLPEISAEETFFLYNQFRIKMTYIGLQFSSSTPTETDHDKMAIFNVFPTGVVFLFGNNMSVMSQKEAISRLKLLLAAFCTIYSYQFFIDRVPQEIDPSKRESAIRMFRSLNPEQLYNL